MKKYGILTDVMGKGWRLHDNTFDTVQEAIDHVFDCHLKSQAGWLRIIDTTNLVENYD